MELGAGRELDDDLGDRRGVATVFRAADRQRRFERRAGAEDVARARVGGAVGLARFDRDRHDLRFDGHRGRGQRGGGHRQRSEAEAERERESAESESSLAVPLYLALSCPAFPCSAVIVVSPFSSPDYSSTHKKA